MGESNSGSSNTDDVETRVARSRPRSHSSAPPIQRSVRTIGRYLVVERIGVGGMGEVHKAYDPELGRVVAIKVMHRELDSDGGEQRLLREAQAIAQLSHPNVIAVHDVGTSDGALYVAMEFVDGLSLGAWLRSKPRDRDAILDVFLQAARGLAAAHDAGLVHRDFKPANVLVGADGRVRVLDFGLARRDREPPADEVPIILEEPALIDQQLTRPGAAAGTPRYMAPEQHLGRAVDARADQFAFCCALYEALTRTRPFDGGDKPVDLALNVVRGHVRPISDDLSLPDWLSALVLRGLRVNPGHRFPSMHDLIGELQRDRESARRASLDGSATTEAMIAAFPPPSDKASAERVQWLRERLEYAWGLKRKGDFAGALELSKVVVREAEEVDYLPLRAASLYILGNLQHRTGDPASARETLYRAAEVASHAGDDWQIANIMVFLVGVLGDGLRRFQEADGIARVAAIALARLGDNPSLRSRLHIARGSNLRDEGRCQDALREYELALALDQETHGDGHPFVVISLAHIADALLELDRADRARPILDRAIAICREHGNKGPWLARCLHLHGRALADAGARDIASAYLEEAVRIWQKYPDRTVDLGDSLTELSLCRFAAGDVFGAVALGEEALVAHRAGAFDPLAAAATQLVLANALGLAPEVDADRVRALAAGARDACGRLGEAGARVLATTEAKIRELRALVRM